MIKVFYLCAQTNLIKLKSKNLMKKILLVLSAIVAVLGLVGCGGGTSADPVYKFTAKVNNTSWATDLVEPSPRPTQASYVRSISYSPSSKSIYVEAVNPSNSGVVRFYVYITSPASAEGTYTCSSGSFSPYYELSDFDSITRKSKTGQFDITKFSYSATTGKITSFSGKFSFTLEAEHSDGKTRTTTVTDGQVNNLIEP